MKRNDVTQTMDESSPNSLLDRAAQGLVGKPMDRIDGPAKTTGTAKYAYEHTLPNTAWGAVIGATIALGRIRSMDLSAARAAPGVIAVLADRTDLPSDGGNTALPNGFPRDLPAISFFGQPIGLVVAESLEQAQAAARLIQVDYETAIGRYSMEDNLASADPEPKTAMIPNTKRGDIDAAMAGAAISLDETYITPHQFPHAIEPHAITANWVGDKLELHSCQQLLKWAMATLPQALGLSLDQIRIFAPFIGGGFGGKTGVGAEVLLAAMAAREIGRPVKVALTRRQVSQIVHHRPSAHQRIRIGCTVDGRMTAMGHDSIVSQKPGRAFIEPVPLGSISLYAGEARSFTTACVALDLPAAGAVRAPGEAIGTLALEVAMDEMAERLGMDPIDFRKLNEPDADPHRGTPFSTRQLIRCYDEGAKRFGWSQRSPTPGARREGDWLIGHGMAAAARVNFLSESAARVRLEADGRAVIESDMTDIGTGTYTILAQIAGDLLGLAIDQVEVRLGDSALPAGAGSGGSFGAASSGASVALACHDIVAELARRMGAEPDELTLQDGHATARNRRVPIVELLNGESIEVVGTIKPGKNSRAFSQAAHGAQFAEVAVSAITGEVRVRRMTGVFDCGRILNAKTARSQALGGMIWGIGYALHEEALVDPRSGAFVTQDLAEYHIASHADAPPIEVHFVEDSDRHANPLGVKGLGELGNAGAGAAVANAIYNAVGARIRSYPITPDKLLPHLPPL